VKTKKTRESITTALLAMQRVIAARTILSHARGVLHAHDAPMARLVMREAARLLATQEQALRAKARRLGCPRSALCVTRDTRSPGRPPGARVPSVPIPFDDGPPV